MRAWTASACSWAVKSGGSSSACSRGRAEVDMAWKCLGVEMCCCQWKRLGGCPARDGHPLGSEPGNVLIGLKSQNDTVVLTLVIHNYGAVRVAVGTLERLRGSGRRCIQEAPTAGRCATDTSPFPIEVTTQFFHISPTQGEPAIGIVAIYPLLQTPCLLDSRCAKITWRHQASHACKQQGF